jgi:hypothetical protein
MSSAQYFTGATVLGIVFALSGAFPLACSGSAANPSSSDAGPPTNHALNFNGVTDYAQAGNANFVSSSSPQTVSMWVWFLADDAMTGNSQAFVALQRDTESGLLVGVKGGKLAAWRQYEDPKDPPLASVTLPSPGWHHVAYVLDVDFVHHVYLNTLFVDGNLADTSAIVPNNLTPSLVFFGSSAEYQNFFAGYLDEIRIWNVARTGAEVVQEMNGQINAMEPGLVAYFNCNEILDGGLLPDNSGNGNNAILGGGDPEDMPTLVPSDRPQPNQ